MEEKIEKALETPVTFSFVDTPVRDVIDFLKQQVQINIVVDRRPRRLWNDSSLWNSTT